MTLITGGGMPGWQITLIAVGAALAGAALAVLLDRAWAARKTHPAPTRLNPPPPQSGPRPGHNQLRGPDHPAEAGWSG